MNGPTWAMPVLTLLRAAFPPTDHRLLVLVLAAILTPGRRTVTNLLRTVRAPAAGQVSSSQRVFSQRRWAAWALARLVIMFLLDDVVPPGSVLLAGADPVLEPPGPPMFGQGWHRGGGRATHHHTAAWQKGKSRAQKSIHNIRWH